MRITHHPTQQALRLEDAAQLRESRSSRVRRTITASDLRAQPERFRSRVRGCQRSGRGAIDRDKRYATRGDERPRPFFAVGMVSHKSGSAIYNSPTDRSDDPRCSMKNRMAKPLTRKAVTAAEETVESPATATYRITLPPIRPPSRVEADTARSQSQTERGRNAPRADVVAQFSTTTVLLGGEFATTGTSGIDWIIGPDRRHAVSSRASRLGHVVGWSFEGN